MFRNDSLESFAVKQQSALILDALIFRQLTDTQTISWVF